MGVGARQVQGLVDPVHGVGVAVSHDPVAAERRRQRERPLGARLRDRPAESRVEVVDLGVQPGEVLPGAGTPKRAIGSVALGEREVVAIVVLAHGLDVGRGGEALAGVGADRLEHPQPGWRERVLASHEQALGDQAVERVQSGGGDRLGRLDGRAAGEHREPREAALLVVAEQLVAPVDSGAQRLLARGCVARARARRAERGIEAVGDLGRRQQSAAGGRELDRQRQPVDAPADLRDRGGVAVA